MMETYKVFSVLILLAVPDLILINGASYKQRDQTGLGQEIIGPIDFDCPNNGVFPNPEACDQYIDCWMGDANLWKCTDFMLFDLVYNGCNYAQYVHCDDRPIPTGYSTPATTPPTTTSNVSTTTTPRPDPNFDCPEDGVFAHEERCEYYWQCWAGEAELIHCQLDYLFDRVYMGCNFPQMTDCDHRIRPGTERPPSTTATASVTTATASVTTVTVTTTRPSTNPSDPETEGTIPTGETTTLNPNATTTTPPPPPTTTTRKPGDEFECPEENGDYPDPADCRGFYTCADGVPYHNMCPGELYFNPETNECDYPSNVDCENRRIKNKL